MSSQNMLERIGSIARSPYSALSIFLSVPLLYSGGQEIVAKLELHDSYYFLLRSESYDLWGEYFAPIREYTYSFFVFVSRALGFNLRIFEVLCYGASLFVLWRETVKLTKSAFIGWVGVLPLTLLTFQHPVFNEVTADVLQLILVPLSIASAMRVYRSEGSLRSTLFAGLVAGLQVVTRPEGFLFLAPPLVALLFVSASRFRELGVQTELRGFLRGTAIICLIPLAFLQGLSAMNQLRFGFWSPTIMSTEEFKGAYSALMSIEPAAGTPRRYTPVALSTLERAYEVSPALRKTKFFFDQNSHGSGWSGYAYRRYRPEDGSIDGGQFRWALLHAISLVAGNESKAMLTYLDTVEGEIRAGFASGKLKQRSFFSATLGPQFSLRESWLRESATTIGRHLVHLEAPYLPEIALTQSTPQVEADFNRLARRRRGLLQSPEWQLTGRLLESPMGTPRSISLDRRAKRLKIELTLREQGFELQSPGAKSGHLVLTFEQEKIRVPLAGLAILGSGAEFEQDGIRIQLERVSTPVTRAGGAHFSIVHQVTNGAHHLMMLAVPAALLWLLATLMFRQRLYADHSEFIAMLLVATVTLSIILPRWVLLSALDSAMAIGWAARYVSAGACAVWFLAAFSLACGLRRARVLLP